MIYSLSGKLIVKNPNFAVIETGGIGFKIFISPRTGKNLPKNGKVRFFVRSFPIAKAWIYTVFSMKKN